MGCVAQHSPEKKSSLRKVLKVRIKSRSQVLRDHDASHKNSGKNGSIAGSRAKNVYLSGANSVGSQIRGKSAK